MTKTENGNIRHEKFLLKKNDEVKHIKECMEMAIVTSSLSKLPELMQILEFFV